MFISNEFNLIEKEFKNKKNSHSYIFYTNDFFSCQKDVYELIKKIFCVDNLNLVESDFVVIKKSEKKNILKDDMLDLKNFFQKTSYLNNNRIYLIEEAHKLNSISSNMILKFLEEPLHGVVAFFITDNLDSVLSTIKSRCQIVNVFYEQIDIQNNEINLKIDKLLFEENKYLSLFKIKSYFEDYDRNELIEIFKKYLEYYSVSIVDIKKLEKFKVINYVLNMLNNNVNIDYVFDYLLLKGSEL